MDDAVHRFRDLFGQLGLPNTPDDITRFIAEHRPLAPEICLADAPFWTPQQAKFLRDGIQRDADWAEWIDSLDASLRHPGPT